jgi:rhamnogalacturonyl hydrolase YesR
MKKLQRFSAAVVFSAAAFTAIAQPKGNDVTAPLHALPPAYPIPYEIPTAAKIKETLDKVYKFLDGNTPAAYVNRTTNQPLTNLAQADTNTVFQQGSFRLTSYEWGVTYTGMFAAGQATGDSAYTNYARKRQNLLADGFQSLSALYQKSPTRSNPLRGLIAPHALDDGGAITASLILGLRTGGQANLRPVIDHFIEYISKKEFRLPDGTLARNRPQPNTLWLDDLFMSVPALAQMGKLTGDKKYYDDAVKQVLQFSKRMWNAEKGLYMHGWVQEMDVHPQFHWGRANGWAVMTMAELLDLLPENHPGRAAVLKQYQAHVAGLARYQSGQGFWHQLLDKSDSYLETSCTAIYCYAIAKGINRGWLNAKAYAPMCLLAWNAVTTKVNASGEVEGTCVGTGMGFEPAFYYYRPINVFAAHGYGPVLLAGAEVINLLKKGKLKMDDSSMQWE